ncbi:MAG TPA: LysM peptidoglycan-binding domain-containing protein [Candidatus Obscuribacterales bacterium]
MELATQELPSRITAELSAPTDVRAAHQFFSQPGSPSLLPELQTFNSSEALTFTNKPLSFNASPDLSFVNGTELTFPDITSAARSAESALANAALMPKGAEAAALLPGAESALGAIPPGGEPISPIIQLIMRMPGHIGLLNSFFEALTALFFGPSTDLFAIFNPAMWLQHGNAAMASLASLGEHIPISISLLPANAPIFQMFGHNFAQIGTTMGSGMTDGMTASLGSALPPGHHFSISYQGSDLTVSGYGDLGKPLYEQMPPESANPHEIYSAGTGVSGFSGGGEQLAFDSGSFRPTMGGMQQPSMSTQVPVHNTPAPQPVHTAPSHAAQHTHHSPSSSHGSLLKGQSGDVAAASHVAQPTVEGGSYTIKPGDNLWDIAKEHLGDGSKWTSIYESNQSVLGSNPDLIHPGTNINLPDGGALAQGKYVVQPGDNLWDIASKQLGDGQHWPDIYQQNASVIGGNPRLIHPGQELHLGGGTEIAHNHIPHHTPTSAHHAPAHSAHHSPTHHAPHHSPSHHAPAHHGHEVAQGAQPQTQAAAPATKAVEASSQQVPRALAQSPSGEQGLHAQQPMGSLNDLKLETPSADQ